MSKPKTPRLTSEQRTELAACYCMWRGVDPGDEDWGSEMVVARRHVAEMLGHWERKTPKRKRAER